MSRADGFTVMDVSTDIANDPKFRRVQRRNPDHVAPAFMVYAAVLGESWKAGGRVTVADAWPVLLPFDEGVVVSMVDAGLLDGTGFIPVKAWRGWFKAANERREKARERWRRANDKRLISSTNNNGGSALAPRGNNAATATSVPYRTAPSVPSVPTEGGTRELDGETEVITWLARHGCALSETNGLRRKLITLVERFGANAVVGKFDRLSSAGVLDGDARGFVFGAEEALFPKPDLKGLEREERAEDGRAAFDRGVEKTQRMLREMRGETAR